LTIPIAGEPLGIVAKKVIFGNSLALTRDSRENACSLFFKANRENPAMRLTIALFFWVVFVCDQAVAEDQYYPWPKFTVSPSGRFIAATYRSRNQNASRLVIFNTAKPPARQVVGDDYPEYPGVAFSKDERWLMIVDQRPPSEPEYPAVKLLRLSAGGKFELAASLDFRDLVAGITGTGPSIRSGQWELAASQFVLSVTKAEEPDSQNFRLWQIAMDPANPKQRGHVLADNKYSENNLRAFEQKGIGQNTEDQLNAIYTVLRKNLHQKEQTDLIEEEKKWLKDREKLPIGFDQSFFTDRRVQELVKRVIVQQGTANHLDTDAEPTFVEFEPLAQGTGGTGGTPKWKAILAWQNRTDTWQPDNWQVAVSPDSAFAVVSWLDAMDHEHVNLGKLVEKTLFQFDQPARDEMKTWILTEVLSPHQLKAEACDQSTLTPDHWADADNVVISATAGGQDDKLSFTLTACSLVYNVKKQEVTKILDAGKFESNPMAIPAAEGKDEDQPNQGTTSDPTVQGSQLSPDRVLKLVYRHLSTGNWIDVSPQGKSGNTLATSINADSTIFKDAFALHGLNQANDLGDHYGASFEGWVGKGHQFIVGFHCQLAIRGPHGSLYRFSGWTGVYDPDSGKIVEQLTPGGIEEPI
jgi:hypothetical protein